MQLIKGFVTIEDYIDNTTGVVAPIGELSNWSLSYKREKKIYTDVNYPTFRLTTFTSKNRTTNLTEDLTSTQYKQILEVVQYLRVYGGSHIRPYSKLDVINSLNANFLGRARTFQLGTFRDVGNIALPEWIAWISSEENDNEIRIWLSDEAFRSQYDEYEIVVIPPFDNVDHFFSNFGSLSVEINNLTTPDLLARIEQAKNNYPETYLRVLNFDFFNIDDPTQSITTEWGLLIYGKAGDNIDTIKDKLEEYILGLSTYSRTSWVKIFPDIFKRTEFIIVPRWDKISIPNLTINSALYSSMIDPNEMKTFISANINVYPDVWVNDNITILPYDYKAVTLGIIDGPDNITGKEHIDVLFSDYIPVPTSSVDFNRMSIYTRDWSILLESALISAETVTSFTSIPEPLRKVEKLGVLYVAFLYDNVNYLVAAKTNNFY